MRFVMGLRRSEGASLPRMASGAAPAALTQTVHELSELGLVETFGDVSADNRIRATALGRFVLNEIVLRLAMSLDGAPGSDSPMDNPLAAD